MEVGSAETTLNGDSANPMPVCIQRTQANSYGIVTKNYDKILTKLVNAPKQANFTMYLFVFILEFSTYSIKFGVVFWHLPHFVNILS